jgi:hypothetical protein
MAGNKVDAIFASEAIAQIIKVKQELALADAELINLSQNAAKASASIRGISSPSGLDKTVADTTQLNAELERQNKIIQGLETQIKRLSQVRATNNKMSAEEAVNQRILNKNALDQAKAVSSLVGAYDKLNLAHQKAFKNAQNIGAQYGVTSDKFLKASEKANKLDKELKTLDATLGKHNRNVGNYASGYNALGNSINQLSREAPAFANSMNTGFMAISNNIPALTDAIRGIRAENKALAAEGKPTVSVFKQLAGAIFSWQTLISLGVTLLTLYGGKIVEWARNLSTGAKAQDDLNKAMAEGSKNSTNEVAKMDVLYRTATNLNLSYAQRQKAVDQLQKQYPSYFANIDDEVIKNGQAKKSYDELKDAIIASSRAKAIEAKLQEKASERLEKELELQQRIVDARARFVKAQQGGQDDLSPTVGGKSFTSYEDRVKTAARVLGSYKTDLENFYKSARNEDDLLFKALEDNRKKSEKYEADTISPIKTGKEKGTRAERAKKEAIELKSVADTISQINAKIAELQQKAIVGEGKSLLGMTDEEVKKYKEENSIVIAQAKEDLDDLIKLKTTLNALPTASTTILQPVKKEDVENLKELSQEMKDYLSNFTSDFINQSGFTNTFKILNDEIDGFGENASVTFNAIAESAQEMFNFISNASQANFDAEYARLESQKDVSLRFAGESASAKKKIEEDYEKKKKEIAYREAKAKQKQAIFNIAIDTAQAVISAVAESPLTFGLPWSAFALAIGAAQIAMVSSQKIPQYFDGGVHGGGLAMINDAGGSNYVETVVTPDGKVQQFKGRDVVTDLPKGTEIFTPEQWASKELEYMLNSRGVMLSNQASNGFTAEQMDAILAKHFGKIQTNTTVFDKKGIMQFSEMNGNKTIRNANRATGLGFKV